MLRLLATAATATAMRPPIARRAPHVVKFGRVAGENRGAAAMDPPIEVSDDLFWLRDDSRKSEEILGLLRDENSWTQDRTSHLEAFRTTLYDEMLGHIEEDDDTYPTASSDGFEYWTKTVKGKSFKQYWRRPRGGGGTESCYLDVNEVPKLPFFVAESKWDAAQCDVLDVQPSPSGKLVAYSVDGSGYETYNVRLREIDDAGGASEREEQIKDTGGSLAWAGDSCLYYIKLDEQHRPFQVWRHLIGQDAAADSLVYEDLDDLFNVDVGTSRDGALIFIESESKETTELHFLRVDGGGEPTPTLVRAREQGVRYDADSHAPSGSLLLTSNVDGKNREVYVASLEAPSQWAPLLVGSSGAQVLAHSDTRSLDGVEAFADFAAVHGREDGFTQVWCVPLSKGGGGGGGGGCVAVEDAHRMVFEAEAFTAEIASNRLFDPNGKLRVDYSSMTSPRALLEYDVGARTYTTLKATPVPNYDESLYATSRLEITARDGVLVPVTLLWRKGLAMEEGGSPSPLHLYGYGSYGICMDPSFSSSRLALVDRGVVYAIAHVRGGGEMGHHRWYEQMGKYLQKRNTFDDFVDVGRDLVSRGIARPDGLSCEGRSAGGLLVGNVVNLAPDLFCAAVAGVPFVDLMTTMCDPSIPLTTEEWEEWGNPNEAKYYEYMRSYSPIDNAQPGAQYPSMLIVSGLNDPRVAYWEPTKWAQVLRATVANGDDVLLKMDLAAGHFSASDRYRYLRELAFDYAWLLDKLGKAPPSGSD
jgi:oligopeptidase B